jgi:hypothetical protein
VIERELVDLDVVKMSTEEAKPANINHEGYHRRLEAVKDVLKEFGLEVLKSRISLIDLC